MKRLFLMGRSEAGKTSLTQALRDEKLQGSVLALPNRDQIDLDIKEQLIVELYSK